jgi:glycosyltransferase involved in cell wall biosynthesis
MNLVAITVCYNTPDLIEAAINSIKRFYPELKIIIVDNSPQGGMCYRRVDYIKKSFSNITVIHTNSNVGHGVGLNIGIEASKEENILIFDSDIEMRVPCLEVMQMGLKDNYGIGQVIITDDKGYNSEKGIKYLHPHFAIIRRSYYRIFAPYRNHGAPMLDAMKGLDTSSVQIKDFPVGNYILHKERGTVNQLRQERRKPISSFENSRRR